jgi:hypothetical protein
MQATGDFSVPGTRQTVNAEMVQRAVGLLPILDRRAVLSCMAGGPELSEPVAESVRRLVVYVAEREKERHFLTSRKYRSPQK